MTTKRQKHPRIVLAEALLALQRVLDRKCKRLGLLNPLGDRGTPCTQVVGGNDGVRLFIYEGGYREALFPRLIYRLPPAYSMGDGHDVAVKLALKMERAEKDRVVALRDARPAAFVEWVPTEHAAAPLISSAGDAWGVSPAARAAHRLARAGWCFAHGQDDEARKLRDEALALRRTP